MAEAYDPVDGTKVIYGSHEHAMIKVPGGGFGCDGKGCTTSNDKRRWDCTKCGGRYTVCTSCIAKDHTPYFDPAEGTVLKYEHHEHPMVKKGNGGFGCDGKGCTTSNDKRRWDCTSCGGRYTVCTTCISKAYTDPNVAAEAEEGGAKEENYDPAEGTIVKYKNHEHPVVKTGTGGFGCDGHCNNSSGDKRRWDCTVCGGRWTVCGKCVSEGREEEETDKGETEKYDPPEGTIVKYADHEHTVIKTGTGGFGCDGHCNNSSGDKRRWDCTVCGGRWTVCGQCVSERHGEPEPEKEEPAPVDFVVPETKKAVVATDFNPPMGTVYVYGGHNHPLVRRIDSNKFSCDGIGCSSGTKSGDNRRWDCLRCGTSFTVCSTCVAADHSEYYDPPNETIVTYGGHEHPMERDGRIHACDGHCDGKSGDDRQWVCTVCGKSKYTVCGGCVQQSYSNEVITDQRLERLEKSEIRNVRSKVSDIERSVDRFRDDLFYDQWEAYEFAVADLRQNRWVGTRPEVVKTLQELEMRTQVARKAFLLEVVTRQAKNDMRPIKFALDQGKDKIWRCDFQGALSQFKTARDGLAELQCKSEYCVVASVADFLVESNKTLVEQEQIVREKMLEREIENKEREIGFALDQSKSGLDHYNQEKALQELNKARDMVADLEATSEYRGHPVTERILARTDQEIPSLAKQISDYISEKEMGNAKRDVQSKLDTVTRCLDRNDAEAAAHALKDAQNQLDEFSEEYEGQPQIKEFVAAIGALKDRYRKDVTARALYEAKHLVTSSLGLAEGDLDHLRFESFLKNLNNARSHLTNLAEDVELAELNDTASFIASSSISIRDMNKKYAEIIAERANDEARRNINHNLQMAKDDLNHHRHESCLRYIDKTYSLITEVKLDPDLTVDIETPSKEILELELKFNDVMAERTAADAKRRMSDFTSMAEQDLEHGRYQSMLKNLKQLRDLEPLEEFVERDKALMVKYHEKVTKHEADEAIRKARSMFDQAKDALNRFDFARCFKQFKEARELTGAVSANPDFASLSNTADYVSTFAEESAAFEKKLLAAQAQRQSDDLIFTITNGVSLAEGYLDHHVHDKFLSQTRSIANAVLEFEDQPELAALNTKKLEGAKAKVESLKEKYAEKMLEKAMSDAKHETSSTLGLAKHSLDHYDYATAMRKIRDAKTQAASLFGDPLLATHKEVDAFFASFKAEVEGLEKRCTEELAAREKEELARRVQSALNLATTYFEKRQDENFLNSLRDVSAALDDSPNEEASQKLEELSAKFAERAFTAEIDRRVNKCNSQLEIAASDLDHSRLKRCLAALNDAKGSFEGLMEDERFSCLKRLDDFSKEFLSRHKGTSDKLTERLQKDQLDEYTRTLNGHLRQADSLLSAFNPPAALKQANLARDMIEDDQYTVEGAADRLKAFDARFLEEVADKQIQQLISKADVLLKEAERKSGDQALKMFNDAIAAANELGKRVEYKENVKVVEFFGNWKARISKFRQTFEKKQIDEAISGVKEVISRAEKQVSLNLFSEAFESLDEASGKIAAITEAYQTDVSSLRNQVEAAQKSCATKFVSAGSKLDVARKALERASTFLARYCEDLAEENIQQAKKILAEFAMVSALPEVTAIVDQLKAVELQWAQGALLEEAKTLLQKVSGLLAEARHLQGRGASVSGIRERSLKARNLLSEADELLLLLPEGAQAQQLMDKFDKEFGPGLITEEEKGALKALGKQKQNLVLFNERGVSLGDEFQSAAASALRLGPFQSTELDSFKKWAKETLNRDLVVKPAAASGGKRGSGGTIRDLCGGSFLPAALKRVNKIKMDTSIDPDFMRDYKQINTWVDLLNRTTRDVKRILEGMDANGDPWKQGGSALGELRDLFESKIPDFLKKFGEDPTATKWRAAQFDDARGAFLENQMAWNKASSIFKEWKMICWGLHYAMKMFKPTKELSGKTNYVFKFHEIRDLHVPMNGGNMFGIGQFDKSTDWHNICLKVSESWVPTALSAIDRVKEELGGVPNEAALRQQFEDLRNAAIRRHGPMMIAHLIFRGEYREEGLGRSGEFNMAAKALANYPLARAAFLKRYEEMRELQQRRRNDDGFGKKFKEDLFTCTASSPAEEKAEWYDPVEYVVPGAEGTVFQKLKDESGDTMRYGEFRRKYESQIVFQPDSKIDRASEDDSKFVSSWEYGPNKSIFARAFWPTAFRNFQLGKSVTDGSPVYGPKKMAYNKDGCMLEIVTLVYIDGQLVPNAGAPNDDFTYFDQRKGNSGSNDFWGHALTCNFPVVADPVTDYTDNWSNASQRMAHHLVKAGVGKHQVKVEVAFRVVASIENIALQKVFPFRSTPLSVPVSIGELSVTMPNGSVMPNFLPPFKSAFDAAETARIEGLFLEYMKQHREWGARGKLKETPLRVAVVGGWYVARYEWYEIAGHDKLVKLPAQHAINFNMLMYRSPGTGWDCEHAAVFELSMNVNVKPNEQPSISEGSFYFQGVGSNTTTSMEHLSEADIALIPERCAERMREIPFKQ